MSESFGTRLRRHREQKKIALTAIAERTKIKVSLLEELERDDTSNWPTGIFRRAFVRSYAVGIGLEPGEVLREFLAVHPDPAEEPPTAVAAPDQPTAPEVPPTRLRDFLSSAADRLFGRRDAPVDAMDSSSSGEKPITSAEPVTAPSPSFAPDFRLAADLCTRIAQVKTPDEMSPLLQEMTHLVGAVGLIVWIWDGEAAGLKAALAHGYSERVLAQLPAVRRDDDNATAAAFRSARTCVVSGSDRANSALAVPLMTSAQCAGVLAVELRKGCEQIESVRVLAILLAAQLAALVDRSRAWSTRPMRAGWARTA